MHQQLPCCRASVSKSARVRELNSRTEYAMVPSRPWRSNPTTGLGMNVLASILSEPDPQPTVPIQTGTGEEGGPCEGALSLRGWIYAGTFAFFFALGWPADSENISSGRSLRIFSPGMGTGYSPVRHPRQTSSRECFKAEIRPRRDRYPTLSARMKSTISGTVFSFAMNWSRVFM